MAECLVTKESDGVYELCRWRINGYRTGMDLILDV